MFTIHYIPDGMAYSDFHLLEMAQSFADRYKKEGVFTLHTSTGNIIEAIRVMVSRREIPHDEVQVHFKGEMLTLNEHAEYSTWPVGFMSHERDFLREMLKRRRESQMK